MNKVISLGLILSLVCGCSLAPQYTRPPAPVPAQWPGGPAYGKAAGPGPAAPDIKWEDFIQSEPLRKVIGIALANNKDLRLASLNVERAQAIYRVQRAELLPTVNAGGLFSKERTSGILAGTGEPRTLGYYNVNLGISAWEIDLFGRIRSLKDQALEQYLATEEARRGARIALISQVAYACLTLAADREGLRLARSTLEAQQVTYSIIKKRYDLGASSELELRQAQTRLEAARVDIARYTGLVALAENALNLLAGTALPAGILPDELDKITAFQDLAPGMPSEALLRRPDILQAEHLLKSANANIGAARAALFPRITLTTSIGTTSDELSGLFKAGTDTWSFVPRVVVPIFDARAWSAYDVAKADREILLTQYEKAIQSAFREVADALAQRGTLAEQLEAQQSLVTASAETYRLSNARYTKGVDSYLGVLDAQRSLYGAQQGLISIRLARLANLITLYKVLGGGR